MLIAKRDPQTLKQIHEKDFLEQISHIFFGFRGRGLGSSIPDPYRSTSPNTISNVPMIATTSATNPPATMRSRACKFTNDGGRTRTRYGCVAPSDKIGRAHV